MGSEDIPATSYKLPANRYHTKKRQDKNLPCRNFFDGLTKLGFFVALIELLNTSACFNVALASREEGVTL